MNLNEEMSQKRGKDLREAYESFQHDQRKSRSVAPIAGQQNTTPEYFSEKKKIRDKLKQLFLNSSSVNARESSLRQVYDRSSIEVELQRAKAD